MMQWEIGVLTLVLLTLTACGNSNADESAESDSKQPQVVAIPVETQMAASGDISHFYQTTAVLEAPQQAQVIARISGMVEQLLVEEGDRVKAGQSLAQIDPKHYQLALNKSQAELDVIDQELDRMHAIANEQLISEEQLARLSYQRQAALADRDLAKLRLQYSQVASPIDGVIAKRYIDQGNMATEMATALFEVVQQQQLHAIVHLPEQQLPQVSVGQVAELSVDGLPHAYRAEVLRIAPTVDADSGTIKITLQVDNQQQQLRSGMLSRAKLQFDHRDNVTLINAAALLRQDSGHSVFVIDGDNAQIRPVQLGYRDGEQVQILDGINVGEQVVIRGQHQLKDNARVEVVGALNINLTAKE
ncbi:efflux RND transporter periplasmic adaptor subunit [Ferrimonas senticii]|uniref:efflux RND transporter periplasmic adaptor subunit n=1 Tax=Ferrimonas senticii TaxID=394566 RepID=UPI00048A29B3|nr:efflux RND transporter periplasmic adaptor subunit [Ferrimonas senticii]